MIDRSTDITAALRSRQRGFLLNPFRFGGSGGGGDPHYSNVSLLLHMDGADGSTTFTDSSPTPKTVTSYADAQISTTQSKFGGSSLRLDGTDGYLSIPSDAGFAFGTGDFTVEFWVNLDVNNVYQMMFYTGPYNTSQLAVRVSDTGKLQTFIGNGTDSYGVVSGATTVTTSDWHHIAVASASGVIKSFLDGVQQSSKANATSITSTTAAYIGAQVVSGSPAGFPAGYIDEMRVTKGVARYTADFTPPTAPFPNA